MRKCSLDPGVSIEWTNGQTISTTAKMIQPGNTAKAKAHSVSNHAIDPGVRRSKLGEARKARAEIAEMITEG